MESLLQYVQETHNFVFVRVDITDMLIVLLIVCFLQEKHELKHAKLKETRERKW